MPFMATAGGLGGLLVILCAQPLLVLAQDGAEDAGCGRATSSN